MILVITSTFDEHADILCPQIEAAGFPVFRFDTDQLGGYEVGLDPISRQLSIANRANQVEVASSDITSVWYRRPSADKTCDVSLDDDSVKLLRAETKEWIKALTFALKGAFWVTAPWVLYQARIKANQLAAASDAGLSVPRTLITRDARLLRQFYSSVSNGVVAKTLKLPYIESSEAFFALRTQEVSASDLEDPSLYLCPTIFQEKIVTSHELRIVAMGRRLFAFKATREVDSPLDIRASGSSNVRFEPTQLSSQLSAKIRALLDSLSLPFSSMVNFTRFSRAGGVGFSSGYGLYGVGLLEG